MRYLTNRLEYQMGKKDTMYIFVVLARIKITCSLCNLAHACDGTLWVPSTH